MNDIKDFIIQNFFLLCASTAMIVISVQKFKQHPRISLYSILICVFSLLHALVAKLEQVARANLNPNLTLFFAIMVYSIGPLLLYLFILLSGGISTKKKWFFLTYLPLIINSLLYFLGYVPGARELFTYYAVEGNECVFHGGPLRFLSHTLAGIYLLWLIYISLSMLRNRRFTRGITILGCAFFVVAATVLETFFNEEGNIFLISSTTVVCLLIYYLFLYVEKTQIDTSTGLYNRETYYSDLEKIKKDVTGVIQFDVNGLKYINDTQGHDAGDKALATIAGFVLEAANKKMFCYRVGGDEFLLLAVKCSRDELMETIKKFNDLIRNSEYFCAVGYAYKNTEINSVQDLVREADQRMYVNKASFYIDHPEHNRRK